jgi:hypothetical protein
MTTTDTMHADSRALASKQWFGYGRWKAPYWFVGMEPGGKADLASYDSWFRLGAAELIDCKAHHLDWNALVGREISRWHQPIEPPTQPTWRPLIRLLLAYMGQPTDLESVRKYQRDMWGSLCGETALIELSALRATNLDIEVDRERHRDYRINHIRNRMREHRPRFVVFYGLSYREFYERITRVAFNSAGFCWSGDTLCVLVAHPAPRRSRVNESWSDLGRTINAIVTAGPHAVLPNERSQRAKSSTAASRSKSSSVPSRADDEQFVPIVRNGEQVGRIAFDGGSLRVERYNPVNRSFEPIGFYERATISTFPRKVKEIKCIFPQWAALKQSNLCRIKVSWRKKDNVPNFCPAEGENQSGCSVVEHDGVEIARIYKLLSGDRAVWVKPCDR